MNKVKLLSTIVIGTTLLASIVGCSDNGGNATNSANQKPRTITIKQDGEADTTIYSNLEQIEGNAGNIVEVKLANEPSAKKDILGGDGTVLDSYTVTKVEVIKVYKGKFKTGDIIEVGEPSYWQGDRYITNEGYKMMDESGRYLLLTRTSNKGYEAILGLDQGKFDLNIAEPQHDAAKRMTEAEFAKVDYVGDDADHFNSLKAEVLAKYD